MKCWIEMYERISINSRRSDFFFEKVVTLDIFRNRDYNSMCFGNHGGQSYEITIREGTEHSGILALMVVVSQRKSTVF